MPVVVPHDRQHSPAAAQGQQPHEGNRDRDQPMASGLETIAQPHPQHAVAQGQQQPPSHMGQGRKAATEGCHKDQDGQGF